MFSYPFHKYDLNYYHVLLIKTIKTFIYRKKNENKLFVCLLIQPLWKILTISKIHFVFQTNSRKLQHILVSKHVLTFKYFMVINIIIGCVTFVREKYYYYCRMKLSKYNIPPHFQPGTFNNNKTLRILLTVISMVSIIYRQ